MTETWKPRQWQDTLRQLLNQQSRWPWPWRNGTQGALARAASKYVGGKGFTGSNLSGFKKGTREDGLKDDSLEAIAHVLGYKLELIPKDFNLDHLLTEVARLRAFEQRVKHSLGELQTVETSVRWDASKKTAHIQWTGSIAPGLSKYEVRMCPGEHYSISRETKIGEVARDAPRELFTRAGLRKPGERASFRVYVITDTNEIHSEEKVVDRPL